MKSGHINLQTLSQDWSDYARLVAFPCIFRNEYVNFYTKKSETLIGTESVDQFEIVVVLILNISVCEMVNLYLIPFKYLSAHFMAFSVEVLQLFH